MEHSMLGGMFVFLVIIIATFHFVGAEPSVPLRCQLVDGDCMATTTLCSSGYACASKVPLKTLVDRENAKNMCCSIHDIQSILFNSASHTPYGLEVCLFEGFPEGSNFPNINVKNSNGLDLSESNHTERANQPLSIDNNNSRQVRKVHHISSKNEKEEENFLEKAKTTEKTLTAYCCHSNEVMCSRNTCCGIDGHCGKSLSDPSEDCCAVEKHKGLLYDDGLLSSDRRLSESPETCCTAGRGKVCETGNVCCLGSSEDCHSSCPSTHDNVMSNHWWLFLVLLLLLALLVTYGGYWYRNRRPPTDLSTALLFPNQTNRAGGWPRATEHTEAVTEIRRVSDSSEGCVASSQ